MSHHLATIQINSDTHRVAQVIALTARISSGQKREDLRQLAQDLITATEGSTVLITSRRALRAAAMRKNAIITPLTNEAADIIEQARKQ